MYQSPILWKFATAEIHQNCIISCPIPFISVDIWADLSDINLRSSGSVGPSHLFFASCYPYLARHISRIAGLSVLASILTSISSVSMSLSWGVKTPVCDKIALFVAWSQIIQVLAFVNFYYLAISDTAHYWLNISNFSSADSNQPARKYVLSDE